MSDIVSTVEPRLAHRAAVPYLAIRREVTDGVPAVVDVAFPELFAWLREHRVTPAGPPLLRCREVDPEGEPLEIEAGVPVARGVSGGGPVIARALPPGRYATLRHVGPYRSADVPDLGDARERLLRWTGEQGLEHAEPTGRGYRLLCAVDHLLVGPADAADPATWETEIAYLVVGR